MSKDNFKCNNNNKHYFSNSSFCSPCYNPYAMKYTLQFLIDSNISIGLGTLVYDSCSSSPTIGFNSFWDIEIKGDLIYITDTIGDLYIIPICNLLGIEFLPLPSIDINNILSNYSPPNTTCNSLYCCNDVMRSILTVGQQYNQILFKLYDPNFVTGYNVIYSNCDVLWLGEDGRIPEGISSTTIYISPMSMVSYVSDEPYK